MAVARLRHSLISRTPSLYRASFLSSSQSLARSSSTLDGNGSLLRFASFKTVTGVHDDSSLELKMRFGVRHFSSSEPSHTVVEMPALSPTSTQGNIAKWKTEGNKIEVGGVLSEMEIDKVTLESERVQKGYLAKILAPGDFGYRSLANPGCFAYRSLLANTGHSSIQYYGIRPYHSSQNQNQMTDSGSTSENRGTVKKNIKPELQEEKNVFRPLSPHLSVYKPQFTSTTSIINRISAAYLSAIVFFYYLFFLNMGSICFTHESFYLFFFYAYKLIPISLEIAALALAYHAYQGVRHLFGVQGILKR